MTEIKETKIKKISDIEDLVRGINVGKYVSGNVLLNDNRIGDIAGSIIEQSGGIDRVIINELAYRGIKAWSFIRNSSFKIIVRMRMNLKDMIHELDTEKFDHMVRKYLGEFYDIFNVEIYYREFNDKCIITFVFDAFFLRGTVILSYIRFLRDFVDMYYDMIDYYIKKEELL